MGERYFANNITSFIEGVFEEFNIDMDKIYVLVSDGEAAIKKRCIKTVGSEKNLTCVAHSFAHIVPNALKII